MAELRPRARRPRATKALVVAVVASVLGSPLGGSSAHQCAGTVDDFRLLAGTSGLALRRQKLERGWKKRTWNRIRGIPEKTPQEKVKEWQKQMRVLSQLRTNID